MKYDLKEVTTIADMICDEINVKEYRIIIGNDETNKEISLNYNRDDGWYWLRGGKRKEIKNKEKVAKVFFNIK